MTFLARLVHQEQKIENLGTLSQIMPMLSVALTLVQLQACLTASLATTPGDRDNQFFILSLHESYNT